MRLAWLIVAGLVLGAALRREVLLWEASMRAGADELAKHEATILELWSRIEHNGPVWRREDPDFKGCVW